MEPVLDFAKARSLVESYSTKIDLLIDGYADRKEQIISLL
jgi:hypothetical protein